MLPIKVCKGRPEGREPRGHVKRRLCKIGGARGDGHKISGKKDKRFDCNLNNEINLLT